MPHALEGLVNVLLEDEGRQRAPSTIVLMETQ
jgi:hypothetical protein